MGLWCAGTSLIFGTSAAKKHFAGKILGVCVHACACERPAGERESETERKQDGEKDMKQTRVCQREQASVGMHASARASERESCPIQNYVGIRG
jgi:hypothetical protein